MPRRLAGAKVFVLTNGMRMVLVCLRQMAIILGGMGIICKGPGPSNAWGDQFGITEVFIESLLCSRHNTSGYNTVPSPRDVVSVLTGIA